MLFTMILACADYTEEPIEPATPAAVFAPLGDENYRVDQIEPSRYLGLWYEFAAIPSGVQARCTATTAEYSLVDEETIGVLNKCRIDEIDGPLSEIEGTATPVDDRFSHLDVRFFSSFTADYYVVEADGQESEQPYEWAVVSTYNDTVLWILSREPQMDSERYQIILDRLAERELPFEKLVETQHP